MSKRSIVRPWDRKALARRQRQASFTIPEVETVPSVNVRGKTFYSDRFYLHHTMLEKDADDVKSSDTNKREKSNRKCSCGADEPPPLFSRSELVASLDIKAAILATFSVSERALAREFPTLFGPSATVPTLVLHGRKGGLKTQKETDPDAESLNDDDSLAEQAMNAEENDDDDDDMKSVDTQPPEIQSTANTSFAKGPSRPHFPAHIHFSEVKPAFIPTGDIPAAVRAMQRHFESEDADCDKDSLPEAVIKMRVSTPGVHHPKYMILWETSGSLVVVVSTGNLTPPFTTDASWIQRFAPQSMETTSTAARAPTTARTTPNLRIVKRNDFGSVLVQFLYSQMWAVEAGQVTPLAFVRRHLHLNSLMDIVPRWDFDAACVHLVPTVPGTYPTEDNENPARMTDNSTAVSGSSKSRRIHCYGPDRVLAILSQLSQAVNTDDKEDAPSWLPPALVTQKDRLVVQPTSFGSDWTRQLLSQVVDTYWKGTSFAYAGQRENADREDDTYVDDLEHLDVVWPTQHFINQVADQRQTEEGGAEFTAASMGFELAALESGHDDGASEEDPALERFVSSCLFMSSRAFNRTDIDCLSRMVMYETSTPAQQPRPLCPHIKSVARVFEGDDYDLRKDFGMPRSKAYFSWFLLTSACLSRGAQGLRGIATDEDEFRSGCAQGQKKSSYFNFEIGVLFASRLQRRPATDRLYLFHPSQCMCRPDKGRGQPRCRFIHLPVPFDLKPTRYLVDEGECVFRETPYLHEIPRGTGSVGNMSNTPYGAALAAKLDKKSMI